jgi:hypothetical protein
VAAVAAAVTAVVVWVETLQWCVSTAQEPEGHDGNALFYESSQ